ncbi:hypothetical protein [Streptomyces luteireticuli]|uniref:hypothetical protein n=1 Tax=Streptomyces luteireticuli TaxID=173858 RepID=UPI003558F8D9
MAVVALAGCSGAPGVTTTALALLLAWPAEPGRRMVLAECDPDGGSVLYGLLQGSLGDRYGLRNLSVAARKGELPEAFWRQLVDLTDDAGAVPPRRDRLLLPGISDPAQGPALAPAWEQLADLFAGIGALAEHPHDVLVDLGRHGAFGPSGVLARRADAVVVVARSTVRGLHAARSRVEALQEQVGEVRLVLIQEGRYAPGEVEKVLQVPVVATLPFRPEQARVLSEGVPQPRKFASCELLRAAQRAAGSLRQHVALRRSHLATDGAGVSHGAR